MNFDLLLYEKITEKKVQVKDFLLIKLPRIRSEIKSQLEFIKENLDEIEEELQGVYRFILKVYNYRFLKILKITILAQLVEIKEKVEL